MPSDSILLYLVISKFGCKVLRKKALIKMETLRHISVVSDTMLHYNDTQITISKPDQTNEDISDKQEIWKVIIRRKVKLINTLMS